MLTGALYLDYKDGLLTGALYLDYKEGLFSNPNSIIKKSINEDFLNFDVKLTHGHTEPQTQTLYYTMNNLYLI